MICVAKIIAAYNCGYMLQMKCKKRQELFDISTDVCMPEKNNINRQKSNWNKSANQDFFIKTAKNIKIG